MCTRELYGDDICIYLFFFGRIQKTVWDSLSAAPYVEGGWCRVLGSLTWVYLEKQVQRSELLHDQKRMNPKRPFNLGITEGG